MLDFVGRQRNAPNSRVRIDLLSSYLPSLQFGYRTDRPEYERFPSCCSDLDGCDHSGCRENPLVPTVVAAYDYYRTDSTIRFGAQTNASRESRDEYAAVAVSVTDFQAFSVGSGEVMQGETRVARTRLVEPACCPAVRHNTRPATAATLPTARPMGVASSLLRCIDPREPRDCRIRRDSIQEDTTAIPSA